MAKASGVTVVILSSRIDHGCDLDGHVEDAVVDVTIAGSFVAFRRADRYRRATLLGGRGRWIAGVALARWPTLFSERLSELPAESLVSLAEFPVPDEGGVQARQS